MKNLVKNFSNSLSGKILVANPYCSFGDVFDKSIIYVASNTSRGSFGLIINKYLKNEDIKKFFKIKNQDLSEKNYPILIGGPIEPERSFVIHSSDYQKNLLFEPSKNISISSNPLVIEDILKKNGPNKFSFILGYTGWGPQQLEFEIQNNYWEIDEPDEDVIFSETHHNKWGKALLNLGIKYDNFISQIAHC